MKNMFPQENHVRISGIEVVIQKKKIQNECGFDLFQSLRREKNFCVYQKRHKNGLNKRGNSLLDTGSPSLCPRHTHQRLVSDQRYRTPVLSSPGSSPHKHTHTCQCVGRTQLTQRGPPPKSTLTSSTGHTQAPARLCTTPFKRFLAKNQRFAKTVRPKCFPGSL